MDHAAAVGWSADSKAFGYCQESGGLGGEHCKFGHLDGSPADTFDDEDLKTSETDPKKHAALEARLKAMGISQPKRDWAFARDLSIEWDDSAPETLRIGAKVKGEPAPSYSIVLRDPTPAAKDGSIHLELLALSPDGKTIGAIAHSFYGEYSDTFFTATLPTVRFAAMAYNDAGFAHHKKKDWAGAADLFAKATAADPSFALPAYNLACAYARLGDPKSRPALTIALARAGADPSIATHAKTDEDLASLRGESWFTALVP